MTNQSMHIYRPSCSSRHPGRQRQPRIPLRELVLPISGFVANLFFLISVHVHAAAYVDNNNATTTTSSSKSPTTTTTSSSLWWQFWTRVSQGPDALEPLDKILFAVVILLAFELLDFLTKSSGIWLHSKRIPVRGKHLDELSTKDLLFIGLSKAATAPFVYFYLRYAYFEPCMVWELGNVTIWNTLLPLPFLFVVYDFFYTILHWALHLKGIYQYIHKHHHHQKAPSRANVDAVNVHPIEFFLGEYNHLLVLFLLCRACQFVNNNNTTTTSGSLSIHVLGSVLFLAIGGFLAGINHTRYDMVWKIGPAGIQLFDSKAHDVHHRIPQSNYGQYIMLWDRIFGTYRAYNPKDKVYADAQLDPKTGKSFAFAQTHPPKRKDQ